MGPQAPAVLRWGFCEPTKVTPPQRAGSVGIGLLAWHLTLPLKFVASAHQPLRDPRPLKPPVFAPGAAAPFDRLPPATVVADMQLIYHALKGRSQTAQPKCK
jgi:hypothetical protein